MREAMCPNHMDAANVMRLDASWNGVCVYCPALHCHRLGVDVKSQVARDSVFLNLLATISKNVLATRSVCRGGGKKKKAKCVHVSLLFVWRRG